MDCVLKVYKDIEFYQLGLQVCALENTGEHATLMNNYTMHEVYELHMLATKLKDSSAPLFTIG